MSHEHQVQGIPITEITEEFGTPLYVYDAGVLETAYHDLRRRLDRHLEFFYSLKANPNVSICAALHQIGARAEVSSLTELLTALRAGVEPRDIIFLGPGKSEQEIRACVETGIYALVAESLEELSVIDAVAGHFEKRMPVLLRVNPAFSVKGSGLTMGGKPRQFGIDEERVLHAAPVLRRLANTEVVGLHCYLGTRILDAGVVVENSRRILDLAERLSDELGLPLRAVDVGGGLGVPYFDNEAELSLDDLAAGLNPVLSRFRQRHPDVRLMMELGRFLTAHAGLYVVRARYVKSSYGDDFVVTDGGTNHHMAAVGIGSYVRRNFPLRLLSNVDAAATRAYTVTGPLCTPADTLGKHVLLPEVHPGDLLGVERSGAYGPTASPGLFLSHGYPAEVLVVCATAHLVRARDTPADLLGKQRLPVPHLGPQPRPEHLRRPNAPVPGAIR
jgi:diaminopimelate decarboxylase